MTNAQRLWFIGILAAAGMLPSGGATTRADEKETFFEAKIRPVLVEQCYRCHNSSKLAEGGLAVDQRSAFLEGGDDGPVVVPGKPAESRLLATLRHEIEGLHMPKDGPKLDKSVVDDFEKWIASGAFDPRNAPPTAQELTLETSWKAVSDRRKQWWSFQPVVRVDPPSVKNTAWSNHPIDRFVLAKLEENGLQPAILADKRALLRRASFTLTGLPPTPAETAAFMEDASPTAYEALIDRLLASPRFGEQWARHWMDLVRYCESHGSQGDPELPNAWRYRDYLIRAFNGDVPYNQLVREHLAGDLLPKPRLDPAAGVNESAIGTSHLRMGEFGYIPVDALEDQVKVVDNQIDVFSKTFLGLTVSCARCHDHKFDPISQKDFYALYGVFASCRPGQIVIDEPGRLEKNRGQLASLKERIRNGLADSWEAAVPRVVAAWNERDKQAAQRESLLGRSKQLRSDIESIERPAEAAVLKARGHGLDTGLPKPLARWSFSGDARDGVGSLNGTVEGQASFREGRLVLNGKDTRVRTGPIANDVSEKTLETWVSLANLDQRGVGVISIESDDGALFDSIVYSETDARVWIAGSDYFKRTQVSGGPAEQASPDQWIHLAIVYRKDKSVAIYRNGKPYGTAYAKGELQTYRAGKARVLIGQRHPANAIPHLAGEIDEARLYDKPLTAEEVAASYQAGPGGVSREELQKSLSPEEATRLAALYQEKADLERQLVALGDADSALKAALEDASKNPANPLQPWLQLSSLPSEAYAKTWTQLAERWASDLKAREEANRKQFEPAWDLKNGDLKSWFESGTGLSGSLSPGGEFSVEREGDRVLRGVYQAGVYTHGLSRKHSGVLTSPRFVIKTNSVSIRALGEKSRARLVVENYALGGGGLYPATRLERDQMGWIRLDTAYRKGSLAYFEFATDDSDQAYFGADRIVFHDGAAPPQELVLPILQLLRSAPPNSKAELALRYQDTLRQTIRAFRSASMSPEEASFLDYFARSGLLPVTLTQLPALKEQVEEYRRLERDIPTPRRAPGVLEAEPFDQPLFTRGRHTQPAESVPRRFLEALGGVPYPASQSGRLQLAEEVASADNTLTSRVMVNRLWHYVFGKGLVDTVDNFGRLGTKPTHPELLDYLAARFTADENWSIKRMLRLLMTSETFRQSAVGSEAARKVDGGNAWLSHRDVVRLEAESIRDSILATSGQLDLTMYGPGVNVYFVSKTEGGGPHGPLDGDRRRSVYQRIRRNAHNPFLEIFDAPKPTTTRGKRDVTNVPAQSLTMLNDPFVIDQAAKWSKSLTSDDLTNDQRIRRMFMIALAREPDAMEREASIAYLNELAAEHGASSADVPRSLPVWQDFAQALFCLKEFIYVD